MVSHLFFEKFYMNTINTRQVLFGKSNILSNFFVTDYWSDYYFPENVLTYLYRNSFDFLLA